MLTSVLEPTGHTTVRDGGRPAQLYRRGHAELMHPLMLRSAIRSLSS